MVFWDDPGIEMLVILLVTWQNKTGYRMCNPLILK